MLYRISLYVNVAVINSYHVINSPDKKVETVERMYANLITVKSVLGEVDLQNEEDVVKVCDNAMA